MEQISFKWEPQRKVYSVSELNAAIRGMLNRSFADVWISGEISGLKLAPSGHAYFSIKDAEAQVRAVCFRGTLRFLKFRPQDGVAVLARGKVDVFEPRGEYQFLVEWLEPQGLGALQLAFEQLKKKLEAEGLFAAERKRALPRFPQRIGLVTSPAGAVIRDMIHVLSRRWPGVQIRLYPALVQGIGSIEEVVAGLEYFGRGDWAEVVIVGRGGGALEDLWTFNEESVARAIAASKVPVISAVGHETDFTIADFVADLRAPTPSAAAEMAVPNRDDFTDQLKQRTERLGHAIHLVIARGQSRVHQLGIDRPTASLQRRLDRAGQRVDDLELRARDHARRALAARRRALEEVEQRLRRQDLRLHLAEARRRLTAATQRAETLAVARLQTAHRRFSPLPAALAQLSPLRVLDRGYAIVESATGHVVTDAAQVQSGDAIGVRLARGRVQATVD
ncbi:MAG: exodeoxyribonuclease VII large subunit [Acidobacteria bacterium]|nr:exodeoxyribonuclease VII large subunit [Acidobacteriota bacterium]